MKIVIDIPAEEQYEIIKECAKKQNDFCPEADSAEKIISRGKPLPKGHGRIVDIGPYEGKVIVSRIYCGINNPVEVAELDTIIEAESVEE